MGKVITVASGKGKTGQTMIVAAISSSIAILGHKTLCIDFGKDPSNLKLALCMADNVPDEHIKEHSVQGGVIEACEEHPLISGLYVLSVAALLGSDKPDASNIKQMFSDIRQEFKYCIVDTPHISSSRFRLAHVDADMTIIIKTGSLNTKTDVLRAAEAAMAAGVIDNRLLINRIYTKNIFQTIITANKIADAAGAELIGHIPDDEIVSQALYSQEPLVSYKNEHIVNIFHNLAKKIIYEAASSSERTSFLTVEKLSTQNIETTEKPNTQNVEIIEKPSTQDIENTPFVLPSNLLGSYGDPELWAKSTLKHAKYEDLIEIYIIHSSLFVSSELIRNRMWLHDLLDDVGIPYYIEVGSLGGRKKLTEEQHIYVERKNVKRAVSLIRKYNDIKSIVREKPNKTSSSVKSSDGIPQKKCCTCNKEIDFDYKKCPHCKGRAD